MPNTTNHVTPVRLREHLQRLVWELDSGIPQAFTQATKSFLTAMDFQDPALIRSQLNAAFEAFRDLVHQTVQKHLGWPEMVKKVCLDIGKVMEGFPAENFDEIGKELESRFDKMLKDLSDLWEGPVKLLQEHGYQVENGCQLEKDIKELRDIKKHLLENWPWSSQDLPPVDRNMVAESRAGFKRKEGDTVEDIIRRLERFSTTGTPF